MPRTLLSDIGNVLVTFDFTRAAARFAEKCPLAAGQILHTLDPLKGPLESGQLMGDEFVRQGMAMIEFADTADEFSEIWCDIFATNPAMDATLASLPAALPRHLLSNTSDLHKEHLLGAFPIFRHFQGGVYSYLAGCMKPEERIFRIAIESLALNPAETFFVDDLAPNIATARALGFITHHYDPADHGAFERAIRGWLES